MENCYLRIVCRSPFVNKQPDVGVSFQLGNVETLSIQVQGAPGPNGRRFPAASRAAFLPLQTVLWAPSDRVSAKTRADNNRTIMAVATSARRRAILATGLAHLCSHLSTPFEPQVARGTPLAAARQRRCRCRCHCCCMLPKCC